MSFARRPRAEASYDIAMRDQYRRRTERPGGSGPGGFDGGLHVFMRVLMVLFALIVVRLLWLQVIDAGRLAGMAEDQRTNVATIFAKRGTIYDRKGRALAMSVECSDIYANPKEVKDPSTLAQLLAEELGGDKNDYLTALTSDTTFRYLRRKVDQDVAERLRSKMADQKLTGVYLLPNTKRMYPYGNVGAQVLGMVGDDGQGLSGLELQYNDILTGKNGEMVMETSANGQPIAGGVSNITPASNGTDIVISIDIDLQESCEKIISEGVQTYHSNSGSVMVMDPKSGELLAACSTPLLDFDNVTDVAALSLKPVSSSFEPGSVFKVITTSIGFDLGLFQPDTSFYVPAEVRVGDDMVTDDDKRDYGADFTVREMMRRSSNTAMSLLVQEHIGRENFAKGVARYGIGSLTGIDFPGETPGLVRTLDQYDGATAGAMAFGQAVAIPMVQIVRAFGTVANDGVPTTPHFLVTKGGEEVSWPEGERVISPEAAEMETDVMRTVMLEGTGRHGQIQGYDIAGKTGTGEQASESGGYQEGHFVASLCGFANADNPQVLVYVGLNGMPHLASQSAAYVFHDVMAKSVSIMGIAPVS